MAAVTITGVSVLDNPAPFTNPLQFEIEYECSQSLKHDLEWRMVYVGSADSEKYDQTLDSVLVGPVTPGMYRFVFQADAPDPSKIPPQDVLGVTIILLQCLYENREFARVGYYVNNEYPAEEKELIENPPEQPLIHKITRSILADHPRLTKFNIPFDEEEAVIPAAGEEEGEGDDLMMNMDSDASQPTPTPQPFSHQANGHFSEVAPMES